MTNDQLLDFSWRLNCAVSAARDAAAEGPPPPTGAYIPPAEIRETQRREARIAAREGRNGVDERKAEEERTLLNYLRAKFGPSGSVWEPPMSDHSRRDLEFRELCGDLKNSYF